MYSLWHTGFDFDFEKENTDDIVFGDFTTDIYQTSSIKDVYNWIMSLNMNRSKLIANCFLEEEIDGEVLFDLNYSEVCELFTERNLGRVGLFWLAIFKFIGNDFLDLFLSLVNILLSMLGKLHNLFFYFWIILNHVYLQNR